MWISNTICIQFGQVDNGSKIQNVERTITLPQAYTKTYAVLVNAIKGGRGIPAPRDINLTTFLFCITGPWGDWSSRYGDWITVGY